MNNSVPIRWKNIAFSIFIYQKCKCAIKVHQYKLKYTIMANADGHADVF